MRLDHDDAYQLAREEGYSLREIRERTVRSRQRAERRAKVNEFLKDRKYWPLLRYLCARHKAAFTISEAATLVRHDWLCALAIGETPDTERAVIARYFNRLGKDWLT